MLSRLVLTLKKEENFNTNTSSLFHGALMEMVDPDYAALLHSLPRTPYTQYIVFDKDYIYWHITTLTKEAREKIIDRVIAAMPEEIYIKHKDLSLKIVKYEIQKVTYEELMGETYFGDCSPEVTINFLTPTSFKVDGKYQFYPTVYHLFYSLINKYDSASTESCIFSEDIMQQITDHVEISRYKLASCQFHMEGVKIKAFKGSLSLRIHGPRQFVNLINMMARFGEYSGVGIKTSIGMGAISVESVERRK